MGKREDSPDESSDPPISEGVPKLSIEFCQRFFRTLDTDNNGYLDFTEFLLAMDLVAARTADEKLLWAFKLYDTDNSGVIDRQEMRNIMESVYNMLDAVGAKPQGDPCQRADEMFTKIDADNSGELDVQEFMKGCQEDQELMNLLNRLFNIISHGFGE